MYVNRSLSILYTEKKREEERLEIKLPETLIDSIREDYKNFAMEVPLKLHGRSVLVKKRWKI